MKRARLASGALAAITVAVCLEANAVAAEPSRRPNGGDSDSDSNSSSSSSNSDDDDPLARATLSTSTQQQMRLSFGSPPFMYTTPASRYYLRATLEQLLVLGLGYAQYAANKAGNKVDWDLAADWSSLERKFTLGALSFDNNKFDTNWLTHPLAGYFYYSAARTNRLSIPVSVLFAALSSAIWEYFGEIREHAAINDLISTPMTALPLGESTLHLGAFFQRGRKSFGSTALSWFFAPLKNVHDAIDDLEPARAVHTDDVGLPTDEETWHRIKMGTSVGVTHQSAGPTQGDVRLYASSRLVEIPGYGVAGTRGGWFSEGEVSELRLQAAMSSKGQMVDLGFSTHVLPFGYAFQNVDLDDAGRLRGHGTIIGLDVGADYARHDYDRDRRRDTDRLAFVSSGLSVEERFHTAGWTLRTGIDGLANFAGVDAYALPEETRDHGDIHLVSVLSKEHYYHAYGATLHPRIELESSPNPRLLRGAALDLGSDFRVDWFDSILHRDVDAGAVNENSARLDASDRRIVTHAWVGLRPTRHLRISVMGEIQQREGRVASARAGRLELGIHSGIEVLF